jgi:Putative adhesin/Domain of unknown function (DUF5668)
VASPVMTPTPPRRQRRSLAGPFVLIVLGVVFLLGNLHMISWARLGNLFAHYWPALLIIWGVIKLIEYQQAQREGVPARGIGAGGVLLIICIVVCGLIATQASRFNWSGLRDQINIDDDDFNGIFGEKYDFDDHLEQDFPANASLKVIDGHGAVSVHASDDNKIMVIVRKHIGANNQNEADKYNDETKPTITTIGGLVTVDAKTEGAGDHPVETDLDISIPRKAPASIISRRGDVTLASRDGDVDISSQHGDVSVEDVKGNVKLSVQKSSAKLEQITGDVHIDGRLNEVSVMDVKGGAQLDGEFMDAVKLARIDKTVTFKSSRTDMEFSKIQGELDLNSDDLHADNLAGPVRLTTRSKEIRLDAVSGDLRLKDENGGIEISMRTLGNVQIDNRNGDIQLSVPEKPGFRVDARTRDGDIESDFSELHVDNGDRQASASGNVGNASSHIVLNDEHGGIEIRRLAASLPKPPEPPPVPKIGKSLPQPKGKVEPTEN